ncbi:EVE domain-containing protein [Pseudoalteromonas ruthenica]|uniref:EVE domain-containing protein n=1 Tax=Pseudoalteromonas ruthenica TaxID=151081 RepID=UPI0012441D2D|nr:EVE domain-containing protein [Pseudoalteromonas ruthenica]
MAYWLLKTEPDAFSLADLQAAENDTTVWDGVRNYQARNFIRDGMQVGDKVFIYHSSCKVPAIVGIGEVTRGPYADPTQFDASSDYYDPKATPESPRWFSVDVQYRQSFKQPITLKAIKADPAIAELALKKSGRLSVMPVSEQEWQHLCGIAKP